VLRVLVAIALACLLVALGFLALRSVGPQVHRAADELSTARRDWIVLAGLCFLAAALATSAAWRTALIASSGAIGFFDTTARYAIGSVVNTFVPMRLGDAVRIGLLSRAFERNGRVLRTSGVFAFLGVARVGALALLLLPAAALGLVPVRMLLLAGAVLAVTIPVATWAARRVEGRLGRFLDAFRLIGRSPTAATRVLGWMLVSSASRVGAAAAAASALGVSRPLAAAVIIVPALELSSLVPLTPGNFGVTSGVVAVALHTQGVDMTTALAVGLGFHVVETIVGIVFGVGGAIAVGGQALPRAPRVATLAFGFAMFVALAAAVGAFLDVT
jgi:uncharacterized membrane protein YbhN (UPF0104 family)